MHQLRSYVCGQWIGSDSKNWKSSIRPRKKKWGMYSVEIWIRRPLWPSQGMSVGRHYEPCHSRSEDSFSWTCPL